MRRIGATAVQAKPPGIYKTHKKLCFILKHSFDIWLLLFFCRCSLFDCTGKGICVWLLLSFRYLCKEKDWLSDSSNHLIFKRDIRFVNFFMFIAHNIKRGCSFLLKLYFHLIMINVESFIWTHEQSVTSQRRYILQNRVMSSIFTDIRWRVSI